MSKGIRALIVFIALLSISIVACASDTPSLIEKVENDSEITTKDQYEYIKSQVEEELKEREEELDKKEKMLNEKEKNLEMTEDEKKIINMHLEKKEIDEVEDKEEQFNQYMEWAEKYSDMLSFKESFEEHFTQEEINIMCRVVETECYGAGFEPKVNVAQVILNRIETGKWGKNAISVCTRPNQFTYHRTRITEDTMQALECAYYIGSDIEGALYFHSGKKTETFNGRKYIMTDSVNHHYYM